MKELKPVTFIQGKYPYHRQNSFQQILMLKALTVTHDPKRLMALTGIKTEAEVYRTLDKIAIRKEYHEALERQGISFDYIIKGIKGEADGAEKAGDRIKAFQIFLKSLGMDKYEEQQVTGGSWEDELIRAMENKDEDVPLKIIEPGDYRVIEPEKPESARIKEEHDESEGKSLYE